MAASANWVLRAALLFLSLFFATDLRGQTAGRQTTPKEPETSRDSLGRTTPRSTVLNFLANAQKGDYERAARYLNTRKHGEEAATLAEELFTILDRYLPPKLNKLSDASEGSLTYPDDPNRDLVGSVSIDGEDLDILVDRIDRGKAGSIWLFSSKTLTSVPEFYESISTVRPETLIPEVLVVTRFANIPVYEWLAAVLVLPLLYLALGVLNRLLSRLIGVARRRFGRRSDLPDPDCIPTPVRLLIVAAIIHWAPSKITLSLLARQFWSVAAIAITIGGGVWLVILLNGVAENRIRLRSGRKHLAGRLSILRFVRRLFDVMAVFVGGLVLLHHFGVNVAAAIAGLGVGGIAVALAAQKTLENVIGGVSLVFDRTVRVGDWLKLGEAFGAVEWIGLRSIRIRTLQRTIISVPNGQVASATLESFSSRDKFWFHHIVGLSYETTAAQLRSVITSLIEMLIGHVRIDMQTVRVSFLRFGESSLDVELFAYVLAEEVDEFFAIQQALLLKVMETVEAAGTRIAVPSRTLYLTNDRETGGQKHTGSRPTGARCQTPERVT